MTSKNLGLFIISAAVLALSSACSPSTPSVPPKVSSGINFVSENPISYSFSARENADYDLLTAGLSLEQLRSLSPPKINDKKNPTALELRQLAYYYNSRALIDLSSAGGFHDRYGQDLDQGLSQGKKIYGKEFLTYSNYPDGTLAASYLVQIPDTFDPENPCLITAASSGSRGIYGAVGVAGFWGLSRGCAMAYTDKGTGTGFYFVKGNIGYRLDGKLQTENSAATQSKTEANYFKPRNLATAKNATDSKSIVATKHAHSQHHVEKDWGNFMRTAAHAGLYFLNQEYPEHSLTADNTKIIATGISNAGAAALRAAEEDTSQLFDAVVVGEPNINPKFNGNFVIEDSNGILRQHSKPMLEYNAMVSLYQGCALLADKYKAHSFALYIQYNQARFNQHCSYLKNSGLLNEQEAKDPAQSSLAKLEQAGLLPEALDFLPVGTSINLWNAINSTYFSAYSKSSVNDPVCDAHFVVDQAKLEQASLFAKSSGVPPVDGVVIDWPKPLAEDSGLEPSYQTDLCYVKTLQPELPIDIKVKPEHKNTIEQSIQQIQAHGNLQRIPTIIVHGQADGLIHVNHSSRAYLGLNYQVEQQNSKLKYYEIENAQHFDAFNALPALQTSYIPIHHYYEQALDLMWQHLQEKKPLPASQLVKTQTRQIVDGKVEPLSEKHTPAISASPKHPIIVSKEKVIIH